MFRIYKRTIRIGTTNDTQRRLEYHVEENSNSSFAKILAIPAMIAAAVVGALVLSVFFAVLLIPLSIMGFKAWRLIKNAQQKSVRQSEPDSITAEYTVVSDDDKS